MTLFETAWKILYGEASPSLKSLMDEILAELRKRAEEHRLEVMNEINDESN